MEGLAKILLKKWNQPTNPGKYIDTGAVDSPLRKRGYPAEEKLNAHHESWHLFICIYSALKVLA